MYDLRAILKRENGLIHDWFVSIGGAGLIYKTFHSTNPAVENLCSVAVKVPLFYSTVKLLFFFSFVLASAALV